MARPAAKKIRFSMGYGTPRGHGKTALMAADTVERYSFEARLECHYLLQPPDKVDDRTLLVLALHGYGSNPEVMLRLTRTMLGTAHAIAAIQAPSQFYPANALESTVGYCWTSHVH